MTDATDQTPDIIDIDIPDPEFGRMDEGVLRTLCGDQSIQIAAATSHVVALQRTVSLLREQVAALRAKIAEGADAESVAVDETVPVEGQDVCGVVVHENVPVEPPEADALGPRAVEDVAPSVLQAINRYDDSVAQGRAQAAQYLDHGPSVAPSPFRTPLPYEVANGARI